MHSDLSQYLLTLYKNQILNIKDYSIEIQLILSKNCNLNCTNCQALCNINDTNEFMTLEEIKNNIPILKNFFKNKISNFILFGGEPLLNPEYKEICQYLRQEFPDLKITIFTNGLIISNWTKENYKFAQELNINFQITLYPLIDTIPKIQQQEKIMDELYIEHKIAGSRPYFVKGAFDLQGKSNPTRFFTCCHSLFPPTFYLYKNKFYRCAVSLRTQDLGIPYLEEDYLDIRTLNEKTFLEYCSKPLSLCKYCSIDQDFGTDELIPWHTQATLSSNYNKTLLDMYLNDYPTYFKYLHNCKYLVDIFKNEYFLSKQTDDELPSKGFTIYLNRFKDGIGDVLIPFSKKFITTKNVQLLKNLILNQKDYLKINFYFISLDKDKNTKELMYKTFTPTSCDIQGNFHFLESENNKNIKEIFLNNSYINKKLIINDLKLLFDSNYLYNYFMGDYNNETI